MASLSLFGGACALWCLLTYVTGSSMTDDALYEYVHTPDPNYSWEIVSLEHDDDVTTYVINMTSLQWLTNDVVNRPIWWHIIRVHIPDVNRFPDAVYFSIYMLDNKPELPSLKREPLELARNLNVVSAIVYQIPNQPIRFNNGRPRYEDDLISWTFREFLLDTDQDPSILALFPMTKAAVLAMDTVAALVEQETGDVITRFLNTGESKRGWTTFLTAAVDDRVALMAPVVLSVLNMAENINYHQRSLGGFSFAMLEYVTTGVFNDIWTPEMEVLTDYIDPFSYRHLYTMPTFHVKGASDEFFIPDDTIWFYDDIPQPNYLWIQENAAHEAGPEFWGNIETFFLIHLTDFKMPQMTWTVNAGLEDGTIVMTADTAPYSVSVWSAQSNYNHSRDFRMSVLENFQIVDSGIEWFESAVQNEGNHRYTATIGSPADGYTAFFIKAYFPGPEGREIILSTEACIVPDIIPFPTCEDPCNRPFV